MDFFTRLFNLIGGFFSGGMKKAEAANPEAVYEAAINDLLGKRAKLKSAVAGIVTLRNNLEAQREQKEKELVDVSAQLPIAIESGDDEVALVLLEKKNELEKALADLAGELEKVTKQAEEAKGALVAFQGDIEKLKRERDQMLAKKATAEAQIKIQDSFDGLSTDADLKALESVREHINRLGAEAEVGSELRNDSLDARMRAIKAKTGNAQARSQLEELKKLHAAKSASAAAEGAGAKKTL
jgi:phage shock protein A